MANKILKEKQRVVKRCQHFKIKSKSTYLSISKAKAKQFHRQSKKIYESDEKLQEEDKEYLKNVDHHSNAVANKTIEKILENIQLSI